MAKRVLAKDRASHLDSLRTNILVHDLTKGIPYPDASVEVVYHSHILEHIDRNLDNPSRDAALIFTKECRRVLKPGGVLRIVVPEFSHHVEAYLEHYRACEENPAKAVDHDALIHYVLGQVVLKEATGSARQRPMIRKLENALLGDARKRGQTHQWEYDRFSLHHLLRIAGFEDIRDADWRSSLIPNWAEIGLDLDDDGNEYKPRSLYMEAVR